MGQKIAKNPRQVTLSKFWLSNELLLEKKSGVAKKNRKINKQGRVLEPLEYKLREEKDANCEKLYCCGRKIVKIARFSSQHFLPARFSSRNNFRL